MPVSSAVEQPKTYFGAFFFKKRRKYKYDFSDWNTFYINYSLPTTMLSMEERASNGWNGVNRD